LRSKQHKDHSHKACSRVQSNFPPLEQILTSVWAWGPNIQPFCVELSSVCATVEKALAKKNQRWKDRVAELEEADPGSLLMFSAWSWRWWRSGKRLGLIRLLNSASQCWCHNTQTPASHNEWSLINSSAVHFTGLRLHLRPRYGNFKHSELVITITLQSFSYAIQQASQTANHVYHYDNV
jgi:hypothetical protein